MKIGSSLILLVNWFPDYKVYLKAVLPLNKQENQAECN